MNDTDRTDEAGLAKDLQALAAQRPAAPDYLQQRILANLPEREPAVELLAWLRGSAWRLATATALPLALGFVMGITSGVEDVSYTDSLLYAETWEAYESNEI